MDNDINGFYSGDHIEILISCLTEILVSLALSSYLCFIARRSRNLPTGWWCNVRAVLAVMTAVLMVVCGLLRIGMLANKSSSPLIFVMFTFFELCMLIHLADQIYDPCY
ncbi:hypothetical protein PNOK_0692000 [Pyrrhoderma noxium]|uniref:Uncharacterized protein n=1 Tax=Pyrrhoderma noxium TaxID=2282107 RepID=A0A286UBD0_9AGAM|nr:hypothetical protein PNOK_0692000 [Pyrrhoderma noxium]